MCRCPLIAPRSTIPLSVGGGTASVIFCVTLLSVVPPAVRLTTTGIPQARVICWPIHFSGNRQRQPSGRDIRCHLATIAGRGFVDPLCVAPNHRWCVDTLLTQQGCCAVHVSGRAVNSLHRTAAHKRGETYQETDSVFDFIGILNQFTYRKFKPFFRRDEVAEI